MAETPQIDGLPPGAIVKPISGLPPGAIVRPARSDQSHQSDQSKTVQPAAAQQATQATPHSGYDTGDRIKSAQAAFDRAATPDQWNSRPGFMGHIQTIGNDLGAGAAALATPIVHPLKTAESMGTLLKAGMGDTGAAWRASSSMAKPFVENPVGSSIAAIPQAALLAAGGDAATGIEPSGVPIKPFDPISAYRSPLISPEEAVGRSAADIIKPSPTAYRSTQNAVTEHAPVIRDAMRTAAGGKFRTPLDFAKAAGGAGQEATSLFKQHLIEPNAELETQHGPVDQVYKRLGEINDLLRPSYLKKTQGAELTALEKQQLTEERDRLNDTLYSTLSERSGLSPEKIASVNRRGGALQGAADEADAAQALRREGYSGYNSQGMPIPFTGMERAVRVLNYLRGGPEAVAGRKLTRLFNSVDQPAEELPSPERIGNYRSMAEQEDLGRLRGSIANRDSARARVLDNIRASQERKLNIAPEPNPLGREQITPDTEGARALQNEKNAQRLSSQQIEARSLRGNK